MKNIIMRQKNYMNNKETIKLIEKIKNLKWNDKNLEKHTKKHPIKESENMVHINGEIYLDSMI